MSQQALPSMESLAGRAIEAVVIGASAGGIDAFLALFTALPAGFTLPIIALLHVLDARESRLVEIFQQRLAIPVREAEDKALIQPGTLYFASPGYHLSIEKDRHFSLSCEPPVNFSRPSIDLLMDSAADAYRARVAGIVLTGANQDGAQGLSRIKANGGYTVVQDPAEAQVAIMPQEALRLVTPDAVLKLSQIHQLLLMLESLHAESRQN